MQQAQLIVENTFAQNKANNRELGISVYDRVFHKLVKEGKPLGKIQPIYFKTISRHILFGVLTINQNGSYSFFPELPGELGYDHITFMPNLEKDSHHFTRVTDEGREKVLPLSAEPLGNNTRHAISFIFQKQELLKDVPYEVIYPAIDIENLGEIQKSFVTNDKLEGSTILDLQGDAGSICTQFFLIPNETDYMAMQPSTHFFKKIQPDFQPDDGTYLANGVIPHEYQKNYSLGMISFLYEKPVKGEVMVVAAAPNDRFYSKLDYFQPKKK